MTVGLKVRFPPEPEMQLHEFKAREDLPGRCSYREPGRSRECNRVRWNAVHRFYPCRIKGCTAPPKEPLRSIESRDRHEADMHGGGW